VTLIHRDADLEHRALSALCDQLKATSIIAVPRRPLPASCPNECYWNIADQVASEGGAIVYGWMVIEIPSILLFGWHHAVWQKPSGE
jgi:hypothetical protein